MPRLIIANNDNINMLADQKSIDEKYRLSSAIGASRLAWLAEPGDIVILPRKPSREMEAYIASMRGYAAGAVSFVSPQGAISDVAPMGPHNLRDPMLIEEVVGLLSRQPQWEVWAYYLDRSISSFVDTVGLDARKIFNDFVREGGAELFNDKRVFRPLAASRGIPLAEGQTCLELRELQEAASTLIRSTGSLIVKQDRHSGTSGNIVISTDPDETGKGATRVVLVDDKSTLDAAVEAVWKELAYYEGAPLIIEAYYRAAFDLYAEFFIDPVARKVEFLNWGEQRMEPMFKGFFIPPTVPSYTAARFLSGATELARLSADLGFAGLMDVDAVVTESGGIIFNEINGRAGGCTHIHEIATKVVGPRYGDEVVIAAHNKIRSRPFSDVVNLLKAEGLSYNAALKRGILVTAEDSANLGVIEFLTIGESRSVVEKLEEAFEALIAPRVPLSMAAA